MVVCKIVGAPVYCLLRYISCFRIYMIDSLLDWFLFFLLGIFAFLLGYGVGSVRSYRTFVKKNDVAFIPYEEEYVNVVVQPAPHCPVTTSGASYFRSGGLVYDL